MDRSRHAGAVVRRRAGRTRSPWSLLLGAALCAEPVAAMNTPALHLGATATPIAPMHRADSRPAGSRPADVHEVHVSVSRVAVEGREIFWRIRGFADDLEIAVQRHAGDSTFRFESGPSARADSLMFAYLTTRIVLEADNLRLTAQLVGSGTEADESGEAVRWYVLSFTAAAPPASLRMRHRVLFEVYRDQQNLVTLLHTATERRWPLYFTAGTDVPQTVRLRR